MADVTHSTTHRHEVKKGHGLQRYGWWLLFGLCVLYGLYALAIGGSEIAFRLGVLTEAKERSVPSVFVIHALSGAVVLVTGILQFNTTLRINKRRLHRLLGRVYVVMVWFASLGGLWLALFFNVGLIAQLIFVILALLWFGTTTLAFHFARQHKFKRHRAWMFRSFALSFFFVTFSFWVDGLESFLPKGLAYPLAVFVSWSLNLLIAEIWIRTTQSIIPNRNTQDA